MKQISIIALSLSLVLLASCDGNKDKTQDGVQAAEIISQPEQNTSQPSATAEVSGPVYLNKSAFLSKVHDFESNRDWKFEGDKPVIVDFYADWCKPCKMVAPFLEELAVKYDGQIEVYKVNVDMEQDIAAYYQISSIPTFFFIDADGKVNVDLGYKPKEYFEQRIVAMIGEQAEPTVN